MKRLFLVSLVLVLLGACEPYPVPYFVIDVQDEFSGYNAGDVLMNLPVRYEFSCDEPIQHISITITRIDALLGDTVIYESPVPITVPRRGTVYFNNWDGTTYIPLTLGDYRVDAVLMSDRYGTPEEINSLRDSELFSIVP